MVLYTGPVLVAGGVMTIMCSLEVCIRLYRETKREVDPDLDNLTNPHEVKHWMDPKIIPFGWGLFWEKDEVIAVEAGDHYLIAVLHWVTVQCHRVTESQCHRVTVSQYSVIVSVSQYSVTVSQCYSTVSHF